MKIRILHAHSTFALGGKEARAVRLMNAFGDAAEHTVLSGMPDQLSARDGIAAGVLVNFPPDAPALAGRTGLARLFKLSRYMRRYDLVLTYNWGAFDVVMAKYLFRGPPLVHHEDGFNQDEAEELKRGRNLYRRLGLSAAHKLVVPSQLLESVARSAWAQPPQRIERIPNGIPVSRYAATPAEDVLPGLPPRDEALVIGTVAGLRPVKNLTRLVRVFAGMRNRCAHLVIVGQGPERETILGEARRLGVAERVHLPGFLPDPARYIGRFDIFALSSNSEQFPISLIEAMAAGLPVVATAVGDIAAMVSADNEPMVVAPENEGAFTAALDRLSESPDLRRLIGHGNKERAEADYDERVMIARYARLYGEAIGDPHAFIEGIA